MIQKRRPTCAWLLNCLILQISSQFGANQSEQIFSGGGETESPNVEERLKSDMFKKHYTKILDSNQQPIKAKCNYCPGNKFYAFKKGSGYGTLARHLKEKHPHELGLSTNQSQLSGFVPSTTPPFKYSDEKNRKELAKMIAIEHLSFGFGEKVGFNYYCQEALNPQAKRMPRTSITRELKKIYKGEKQILIETFSKLNGSVSICSDIWSDLWQMHSYMGVTCHWVDSDWKIQKRIIAFRHFEARHTANNISNLLNIILDEYGLSKKKISIGFDNASSNTASINQLKTLCQPIIGGKFFHIRCACHILNLAVQDGLKTLNTHITPIKEAISLLWIRPNLMKLWVKFCMENGRKPKRFSKDVPNRWNSTYKLLNASTQYSTLLCTFFMQNQVDNISLHPNMWEICCKLLELLKVFKDATEILSGVYYPTSHLFVHIACDVVGILQQFKDDPVLSLPIYDMLIKWLNYYRRILPTYLIASVFDPRQKINILEEYITAYNSCIDSFFLGNEGYKPQDTKEIIGEVIFLLRDLFNEFLSKYGSQVPISTGSNIDGSTSSASHQNTSTPSMFSIAPRKLGKSIYSSHKKPRSGNDTELDRYLTTTFEVCDEDKDFHEWSVLEWWKGKEKDYPILSIIAKHILAIPASTVVVEQAFSAGGIMLDEHRSRLLPRSLEIQALVDDWHKAFLRAQEMDKADDIDLDYDTDISETSNVSGGSSTGVSYFTDFVQLDHDDDIEED